jgi:hypothetical protein
MGHHADSGGFLTPGAIKIALDNGIVYLLLIRGVGIHQHLQTVVLLYNDTFSHI